MLMTGKRQLKLSIIREKEVFKWVDNLPEKKKAMGSCIVYHKKVNGYGNYIKFKAYIIAHGFSQVSSKDYSETFFSVTKFTTLYIFLLLAAFLDFDIHQVDIGSTYLEGNLDENIYM